ncbi:T9SS type A sorting domain-containing protein [Dysgonomonas sp. BGC7]|uniref:T9SS type A sorting domain-containing protein n=1 Tax=Dysgonomonas sp. BGC7 TaxID=1658008 RepID=UPI000681D61B|nr:T9SS type A sorting domain-containing protein [Dysgonomonas sp. BGC7]MBD8387935.1 T9SS type A sorting domain-containing protein [Dysgonomonas sp. BGC7]
MKKTILTILLVMGMTFPVFGQLNSVHNHFRPGDILIKQQVEFIDAGDSGVNKLWDFSKVKTINDEYTLTYSLPPLLNDSVYIMGDMYFLKKDIRDDELIVGTEHNTMYYYRLTNDSLLQLGHENPTIKLAYTSAMLLMQYPLNYGQTVVSDYKSKGIYSATVDMQSQGVMVTSADAYGKMIFPSGDTISPVLRVKTIQTILDKSAYTQNPENIDQTIQSQDKGIQLETYRWYSKGYRYPVFETVSSTNLNDSIRIFATAFYFPPQDHLYLDADPENLALLDELWKEPEKDNQTSDPTAKTVTLESLMNCKIYPNPVESQMSLEYDLKQDAKVSFELYSIEGLPIRKVKAQQKTAGQYTETIDCSSLRPNSYILRITANNLFVNEIIIKK